MYSVSCCLPLQKALQRSAHARPPELFLALIPTFLGASLGAALRLVLDLGASSVFAAALLTDFLALDLGVFAFVASFFSVVFTAFSFALAFFSFAFATW